MSFFPSFVSLSSSSHNTTPKGEFLCICNRDCTLRPLPPPLSPVFRPFIPLLSFMLLLLPFLISLCLVVIFNFHRFPSLSPSLIPSTNTSPPPSTPQFIHSAIRCATRKESGQDKSFFKTHQTRSDQNRTDRNRSGRITSHSLAETRGDGSQLCIHLARGRSENQLADGVSRETDVVEGSENVDVSASLCATVVKKQNNTRSEPKTGKRNEEKRERKKERELVRKHDSGAGGVFDRKLCASVLSGNATDGSAHVLSGKHSH